MPASGPRRPRVLNRKTGRSSGRAGQIEFPRTTVNDSVRSSGFRRVALFGTRFTMETGMFGALTSTEVVLPRPDEIDCIHRIYFQLASTGVGGDAERRGLTNLAETFMQRDAVDAIILAGTDLALIFDESNISFPHVDCARVHLDRILAKMLE